MRPSTEEFLYFLLWTADSLLRPTWRDLNDGFEAWAWRNGLGRRVAELQRMQLLERRSAPKGELIVRLTPSGRRSAIGGRDPNELWQRGWDGRWRLVLFDIRVEQTALRQRLWRYLRNEGFGFLQNSVWLTPDPIDPERIAAASKLPNVEALILLEGRPHGGESDAAIVNGSWDFAKIAGAYERYLGVLTARPKARNSPGLREWCRRERQAWHDAMALDPLLPRSLCPADYLGFKAWERRVEAIRRLASTPAQPSARSLWLAP